MNERMIGGQRPTLAIWLNHVSLVIVLDLRMTSCQDTVVVGNISRW